MEEEKKSNSQTNRILIVFVRHAERADMAPEMESSHPIENIHDAPLTNLGIQQAEYTGKVLSFMLQEYYINEVILESSPFLRTMMTASCIATQLQKD